MAGNENSGGPRPTASQNNMGVSATGGATAGGAPGSGSGGDVNYSGGRGEGGNGSGGGRILPGCSRFLSFLRGSRA